MPFDGNGTYNLPTPATPAVADTLITASDRNTVDTDLAGALTNCVTKDGQTVGNVLNAAILAADPAAADNSSLVPSTRWVTNKVTAPATNAASKVYAYANFT